MKIDDNELKRLLQEGMEYEADLIMKEVESNPDIQDVIAPEDIHVNLMKQIQEHKEAEEREKAEQEKEEQELIRLGKKYKKKLSRRKYIILIAAIVCAFAVGSVSFGDGKKVFSEMKRKLGDREQTVVNSGDGERHIERGDVSEEEAYEEVNEKFGFYPIKLNYLPEGMKFIEVEIDENLMSARMCYSDTNDRLISYYVATKHRNSSTSTDVEDGLIQDYEKNINGVIIKFQEYRIKDSNVSRWNVDFVYKDAQYSIIITGLELKEVEEIVENLYFS